VFVTADQNLQFQQNLSQTSLRVIVLVAPSIKIEDLQPIAPEILAVIQTVQAGEIVRIGRRNG
jgi:hypothetical protein